MYKSSNKFRVDFIFIRQNLVHIHKTEHNLIYYNESLKSICHNIQLVEWIFL